MSAKFLRKLRNNLIIAGCCYSIFIGTLSHVVNYEQRLIIAHKGFKFIAATSNIIMVVSIPMILYFWYGVWTHLETNSVISRVDALIFYIRLVIVVIGVLNRQRRERIMLRITRFIFELDKCYFHGVDDMSDGNRRLDILYIVKYITTLMQSVITFVSFMYFARELNVHAWGMALYLAFVQNVIHTTLFQYFTGLLYKLSRFQNINQRLEALYLDLRRARTAHILHGQVSQTLLQLSLVATSDLRNMMQLHFKLTCYTRHLTDCLKYPTLGALLCYLLQYIIFGYYSLMLIIDADHGINNIPIIVGSFFYFVLHLDLYIFYWTCENTSKEFRQSGQLLRLLNELPHLPPILSRQAELFSLQLARDQLVISAGGMFNMNHASSLAFCAYILRTILILVQFEIEYRLKVFREQMELNWTSDLEAFVVEYKV